MDFETPDPMTPKLTVVPEPRLVYFSTHIDAISVDAARALQDKIFEWTDTIGVDNVSFTFDTPIIMDKI